MTVRMQIVENEMRVNPRATACSSLLSAVLFCMLVGAPPAQAQDAASLQARHAVLREQLTDNPFQRPLHLESHQKSGRLTGDIYARIEQPYAVVGPAMQGMEQWCEILILHLNVKGCRSASGDTLNLDIGRKFDQPLADAHRFEFLYTVVADTPDYLQVLLNAAQGPLGTSDYRILFEVVALDRQRSFLRLSYSYAYGLSARLAMQAYLATTGRDKLGFSIVGAKADGEPVHIGGTRGVVERNTMRYYLAIEAYLGALATPPSEQLEKRLNDWHAGVERYPAQLRELERDEYLDMKRREVRRQQAPAA
jgi:hypothetical protein